jgi:hypothetical protein
VTRAFPRQKVGWVISQASFSLGRATLIRSSYLLPVLTLMIHSRATIRPVNTSARATRHPAVHDSYQPIQVGSSGFIRSAACQATVLMVTVAAALTNWIVAARASSLSSACAIWWPWSRRMCGSGPSTTMGSLPATVGGSMK